MVLKRFVNEVAGCYISGSWYLNKCARFSIYIQNELLWFKKDL